MARNIWNWQQIEWPHFSYNEDALNDLELKFSKNTGTVLGTFKHVNENAKEQLIIEILSNEALKTSEIEGEYLDRDSIQSSIKKNLGLKVDKKRIAPAEFGISEMMVDLHKNFNKQLKKILLKYTDIKKIIYLKKKTSGAVETLLKVRNMSQNLPLLTANCDQYLDWSPDKFLNILFFLYLYI